FLRREYEFEQAPRPAMVLLDLNMPRKDGREVLSEIKPDARLRSIPVVVLSSSAAYDDVVRSYELHANGHIQKAGSFSRSLDVAQPLGAFWQRVATLPPAHP